MTNTGSLYHGWSGASPPPTGKELNYKYVSGLPASFWFGENRVVIALEAVAESVKEGG
jgi:hypothetical protein